MIPKRIEIENFLTFGVPGVNLCFEDEPVWVLGGPNGVGKSAVFDAITYALFGTHRGGTQKAERLIRHGANAFRIVFEFEFNGTDYRITRTRSSSGRPTQKVDRRCAEGDWQTLELPRGTDIAKWSEQTLGLGFEAFAASVLLRQGQSDAIINGTGKERLDLLKTIINVEKYQSLFDRVREATRRLKEQLDERRQRRDALTPVPDEELRTAEATLQQAEADREAALTQRTMAVQRIEQAKNWNTLSLKCHDRREWIAAADRRAAEADDIRARVARLRELTDVVPRLAAVFRLRAGIANNESRLRQMRAEEAQKTAERDERSTAVESHRQQASVHGESADEHEREAKRLREEVEREKKMLAFAEEVALLTRQLQGFPPDLDEQLKAELVKLQNAVEAETAHREEKAAAEGLLSHTKQQQAQFANVAVGIPCSTCGQIVDEKHAKEERLRLSRQIDELRERVGRAEQLRDEAVSAKASALTEWSKLDATVRERQNVSSNLTIKQGMLSDLDATDDPATLRDALNAKTSDAERHQRTAEDERKRQEQSSREADRLANEFNQLERNLSTLTPNIQARDRSLVADQGRLDTLLAHLPAAWAESLPALNEADIARFEQERADLAQSRPEETLAEIERDATRREEWAKQLQEAESDIDKIPATAHLSNQEAEQQAQSASAKADRADRDRDDAKAALDDLRRRSEELRLLTEDIRTTEVQYELHKKLEAHLGPNGLLRNLVRTAEREITRLADDTVRKLSDGDLTIDLDGESDDSKALTLRVRRSNNAEPIEVAYLSGSQKFRVSVALALAIGRFARGQARPIESVIIDEGFGSLDCDGLRAAAEELNNLKQHLRRIILVSHQEEFAERFPVRYCLSPGESGTTAELIRQ